jgi:hypothetical protein
VIFDLKITLFSLVEGLIKIKFCTPSEKSTYETASCSYINQVLTHLIGFIYNYRAIQYFTGLLCKML